MKIFSQVFLSLLVLAGTAFYLFYIDAPERWLTPGSVELSDDGFRISLTNISDQPVTVSKLGLAWKVDRLKHHMILFEDSPRKILPRETLTETHTLLELGAYLRPILAADKHKLVLALEVDGQITRGIGKLSRLPVILYDARPVE